jgi:hypothetical protein
MELTIQDWGAVGEIVGGFAVVFTLIYLAMQLRQTSKSLQITNSDAASAMNAEVFQELISNPEFVALYLKGLAGLENLDEAGRLRFVLFCNKAMRFFENTWFLHANDALAPGAWYGQQRGIQEMLSAPGSQEAWALNRNLFSKAFVAFVDELPAQDFDVVINRVPAS